MTIRDNGRGVGATWRAAMTAFVIAVTGWVMGSAVPATAAAQPRAGGEAGAPIPELEPVIEAFLHCRGRLRAMAPADFDDVSSMVAVPGCTGVSVTLRRNGAIIGQGSATVNEPAFIDRALSRAITAALAAPVVKGLPESMKDELGRRLTLDMEFAGELVPVAGRTTAAVGEQLVPGLDGLAMRWNDGIVLRFPGVALSRNTATDLSRQLPGMAFDLGLPAASLEVLRRTHGVRVSKFRSRRLVEPAPGEMPFEPFRGQRLLRSRTAERQDVVALVDGIAAHLLQSIMRENPEQAPGGGEPLDTALRQDEGQATLLLAGDYQAATDRYEPVAASVRDQTLVALALLRYAATDGVDQARAERARDAADVLLGQIARSPGQSTEALLEPVVAALWLRAMALRPDGAVGDAEQAITARSRDVLMGVAEAIIAAQAGAAADATRPERSPVELAVAASGLASMSREEGAPEGALAGAALAVADAAWASAEGRQAIVLLPWIALAERDLESAGIDRTKAMSRLKALVDLLNDSWIGPGGIEGATDVQGGFALEGGPVPLADAQSTRPAIFIALAADWPGLLDPVEAAVMANRHQHTMRFLGELQIRDEDLWAFGNAARAKGGLRAAPWRNDLPKAAQAMGLFAGCLALETTMLGESTEE